MRANLESRVRDLERRRGGAAPAYVRVVRHEHEPPFEAPPGVFVIERVLITPKHRGGAHAS